MPEDLAQRLEKTVVAARRTIAKDRTFSEELQEQEADREREERETKK